VSLYSEEVTKVVQSYEWPPGGRLTLEFVDGFDASGVNPCLVIRMFRDNFIQFDGTEQMRIAHIMNDLIPRLISMGTPTRLEVAKGDGRVERA